MKKILFLILSISICLPAFPGSKKKKWEIELEKTEALCSIYEPLCKVTDNGIELSRIIEVPNMSKKDLFMKGKEVIIMAYKDAQEVIQSENEDAGYIIGKGIFTEENKGGLVYVYKKCDHTIKFQTKEGRCRVSIILNSYYEHVRGQRTGLESENTFSVGEFYPFNKNIIPKKRTQSFSVIKFCLQEAVDMLDYFEQQINKREVADEW